MAFDDPRLNIGGNNPPDPLDDLDPHCLIDTDLIRPLLERYFSDLPKRRDELVAGIERWKKAHDTGHSYVIRDEADLRRTIDFRRQLQEFHRPSTGSVEAVKRQVKANVLLAASLIEGWFSDDMREPVRQGDEIIAAAYTAHLLAKEEAERSALAAEAKRLQIDADVLAEAAREESNPMLHDMLLSEAAEAAVAAAEQATAAQSSATELTRTRGFYGTSGSLRSTWTWEVVTLMDLLKAIVAGEETIDLVTTQDSIITAMVRPKAGRRTIAGLKIYEKKVGR